MVQLTGQLAYLQQAHLLCRSMQDNLSAAMVGAVLLMGHGFTLPVYLLPVCRPQVAMHLDKQQCPFAHLQHNVTLTAVSRCAGLLNMPRHVYAMSADMKFKTSPFESNVVQWQMATTSLATCDKTESTTAVTQETRTCRSCLYVAPSVDPDSTG